MFKFYVVPDATKLTSHSAIYSASNMKLFWDPRSESDAYAIIGPKGKAEINKAGSLEFTVLPTNVCYNDFQKRKSVVLAYDDDTLIFEGYVSAKPRDFYKQRKITCTGTLAYLVDSVQAPDEKNEIVVPEASSGNLYVKVPLIWYDDAKPTSLNWYERSKNTDGNFVYTRTTDTTANPDKTYYYTVTGSGENISGTTITRSAATSEKLGAHISRILNVHNTQVDPYKQIFEGRINNDDTENHDFASTGWRTSWDALNTDILEDYGRYVTITTESNGTLVLNYLDIKQMSDQQPVIEYARNMIEMTESDSSDDVFTVLVPIGKDNLTVSGVSGHNSGGNAEVDPYIASWGGARRYVVVSKAAVARYGYIVKTQSFSDVEDASELYDRAVKYIRNNYDYHTEYDVKAVDLKVLGESNHRISVGDKCRVKSTWHEVDEKDLFVISAEYDYMNPENDRFKIGVPTSDREAGNRRISSQTKNNRNSSKNNASNYSSGSSHTSSILENYIHVTEWGLEMNSRLKNEVESNDGKYTTRFIQDENHLNLAAQKLFGVDGDGRGDKDAGYVRVLSSEYRDGDGPYKNPNTEHWFEKDSNGDYYVSTDTTCDPSVVGNKTYYVQRLWTRYADVDVGPGGIKARVDGNYETSTYCSSWIQSNEDQILALTGHLYVDEEGHAHVTAGSGMRTDHQEDKTTETFIHVQSSMYSQNPNPMSKGWYERVLDSSGAWVGQGKADFNTNPNYYKLSHDTTVNRNKYYYYKSFIREKFVAEYGVYDEDTLTGGVVVRMVNNPTYRKVSEGDVNKLAKNSGSPNAKGWFEYNESTGTFGLTLDTAVPRKSSDGSPIYKYYTVSNNAQTYSDIWGEHIVVGRTKGYSGMDSATRARVDRYISKNNLDGTITEIASDVVVVNTLIAKYIDTDEITVNTALSADDAFINRLRLYEHMIIYNESDETGIALEVHGNTEVNGLLDVYGTAIVTALSIGDVEGGESVSFGEGESNNPADIVMSFDTPTYSGDNVTIRYRTAGMDDFDNAVAITFTKPASLGTVTWSSGNNGGTLTAKTVGGRDFLVGTVEPFSPSGQHEAQQMASCAYLKSETDGYNTVYGITYTAKGANNADVSKKTMLFKTPKNRYPDAVSTFKTYSNFGVGDGEEITLQYSGNANVFAQYKTEAQFDSGKDQKTNLTGVWIHAPSRGEHRTYSKVGNTEYTSGTIYLDYGVSATVYGQRKMDDDSAYVSSTGITVSHKTIGVDGPTTFTPSGQDEAAELSNATTLSYGQAYSISGTYGGSRVGNRKLFKTPSDRYSNGYSDAIGTVRIHSDSGKGNGETISLDYSGTVTIRSQYKAQGASSYTNDEYIIVKAPSDNSSSISKSDISTGSFNVSSSRPNVDHIFSSSVSSTVVSADGKYLTFKVEVAGVTKTYAIDLT